MNTSRIVSLLAVLLLWAPSLHADDHASSGKAAADYVTHPESPAITAGQIKLDRKTITYLTTAGTMTLFDENSLEPTAKVFHISYRVLEPGDDWQDDARDIIGEEAFDEITAGSGSKLESLENVARALAEHGEDPALVIGVPDPKTRPLTFSFNGGPGSSSVWLHLGIFGPKRINYADDFGNPGPAPYTVVDNEASLLDVSDFVFIDPVATGYSRTEGDASGSDFHGVEQDIRSVGEFIRRFLASDHRWSSPKYVAGESYGTTRAAGLANHLHQRHGIGINGVMLVSAILNFGTARFDAGNDLPYLMFLPNYTATAHFHGKLSGDLQSGTVFEAIEEAEKFVQEEYLPGLFKGSAISDEERDALASRLSEFTGLGTEYLIRANNRVTMWRFGKELLRDTGETVGRFDSRFKGRDRDHVNDTYDYDPSYAAIRSIYTQSFNAYVRDELDYESDLPYEILTGKVRPWSYGDAGNNRYVNVAERLRSVMHLQPHMQVFLASGIYDLATPSYAADWTMDHLFLAPELRDNVTTEYYEAGHMMYLTRQDRAKLRDDLVEWYRAVPTGGAESD